MDIVITRIHSFDGQKYKSHVEFSSTHDSVTCSSDFITTVAFQTV